jgi:hypothetical protein
MREPHDQPEFDFDGAGSGGEGEDGLELFRKGYQERIRAFALKVGLPLNRRVCVQLKDGVELRGRLLIEELPLAESRREWNRFWFSVDGVRFESREIASCVRED